MLEEEDEGGADDGAPSEVRVSELGTSIMDDDDDLVMQQQRILDGRDPLRTTFVSRGKKGAVKVDFLSVFNDADMKAILKTATAESLKGKSNQAKSSRARHPYKLKACQDMNIKCDLFKYLVTALKSHQGLTNAPEILEICQGLLAAQAMTADGATPAFDFGSELRSTVRLMLHGSDAIVSKVIDSLSVCTSRETAAKKLQELLAHAEVEKLMKCKPVQNQPKIRSSYITGQKNSWMTGDIFEMSFKELLAETPKLRGIPRVFLMDNFSGHASDEITRIAAANDALVLYSPPNSTSLLQALDLTTNRTMKALIRRRCVQRHNFIMSEELSPKASAKLFSQPHFIAYLLDAWNSLKPETVMNGLTTMMKNLQKIVDQSKPK
jgi:hypothetical protein